MDLIIKDAKGCLSEPFLFWDSLPNEDGTCVDFSLSKTNEPNNAGGLSARHALRTGITIQLLTDAFVPKSLLDGGFGTDRRGWHGDSYDLRREDGERELGSRLWVLRRKKLNEETRLMAEYEARRALQTFIDQGIVARFEITATIIKPETLHLLVKAFSGLGESLFHHKFALPWQQTLRN